MPDVNYDAVDSFYVYPDELVTHGNNIKHNNQIVADSLSNIINTLRDLRLGWAGRTSDEAKDFGDRWNAVAEELFGTKEHPEKGVLNDIAAGVLIVAGLFSTTEHALADYFGKFYQALSGGSGGDGGGSDGVPQSITDPTTTAVTEEW
ncbi:WXG100 family type VII secretion target [Actinoallomurus purpureus]|uniref:WXG100 family type VII secretion target n=1 Tax=Actinoallomurus purpureus TaxID=478114 RepID=UPI0020931FD6|nr:WXG100 family type VII secretion target [Actinoallomurus purpureus]MCO6004187.1 WXG100 family type VII secretion target [Actinoallomurus purpureus]